MQLTYSWSVLHCERRSSLLPTPEGLRTPVAVADLGFHDDF